jgi:uncharacterized Zn-binding protein involved in type VI secretion
MKNNNVAPEATVGSSELQHASARRVVARHLVATLGSRTIAGGTVHVASSQICCSGECRVARVGDEVRYPDGTAATITSGAGFAAIDNGKPLAIAGSHVSNGDQIVDTRNREFEIVRYEDSPAIPGFLDPHYAPPEKSGMTGM